MPISAPGPQQRLSARHPGFGDAVLRALSTSTVDPAQAASSSASANNGTSDPNLPLILGIIGGIFVLVVVLGVLFLAKNGTNGWIEKRRQQQQEKALAAQQQAAADRAAQDQKDMLLVMTMMLGQKTNGSLPGVAQQPPPAYQPVADNGDYSQQVSQYGGTVMALSSETGAYSGKASPRSRWGNGKTSYSSDPASQTVFKGLRSPTQYNRSESGRPVTPRRAGMTYSATDYPPYAHSQWLRDGATAKRSFATSPRIPVSRSQYTMPIHGAPPSFSVYPGHSYGHGHPAESDPEAYTRYQSRGGRHYPSPSSAGSGPVRGSTW